MAQGVFQTIFIPLSFYISKNKRNYMYKKKHFAKDITFKVRYFVVVIIQLIERRDEIRLFKQDFEPVIDHDAVMARINHAINPYISYICQQREKE